MYNPAWKDLIQDKQLVMDDGVRVFYQVIGETHAKTVVLGSGLGGRLHSWGPILDRFHGEYRFINWDYRGLFHSKAEKKTADLSVNRQARDLFQILDAETVERTHACGWSMGVQVLLEATRKHPERFDKLILLNGTHGHALETAFQPMIRVPYLSRVLYEMISMGLKSQQFRSAALFIPGQPLGQQAFATTLAKLWGSVELKPFVEQYCTDVFNEENFPGLLRLFYELNAHSVYHHLPELDHPALVISGGLDVLTPAYLSYEISKRLPRARWINYLTASHFVLLERRDVIIPEIEKFLAD